MVPFVPWGGTEIEQKEQCFRYHVTMKAQSKQRGENKPTGHNANCRLSSVSDWMGKHQGFLDGSFTIADHFTH